MFKRAEDMGAVDAQVPGAWPVRAEQGAARTSSRLVAAEPNGVVAVIVSNPALPDAVRVAE
jgi:hypothetical protein